MTLATVIGLFGALTWLLSSGLVRREEEEKYAFNCASNRLWWGANLESSAEDWKKIWVFKKGKKKVSRNHLTMLGWHSCRQPASCSPLSSGLCLCGCLFQHTTCPFGMVTLDVLFFLVRSQYIGQMYIVGSILRTGSCPHYAIVHNRQLSTTVVAVCCGLTAVAGGPLDQFVKPTLR